MSYSILQFKLKEKISGELTPQEISALENKTITSEKSTGKLIYKNSAGGITKYIPSPNYSIITSDITAANNYIYFVDTSSSNINITIPNTNLVIGYTFSIIDYNNTFGTNHCIILNNNIKINGTNENYHLDISGKKIDFIYVDTNIGFKCV